MEDQVETEVKFHVNDPGELRRRLSDIGAGFCGKVFESNIIWDNEHGDVAAKNGLLRLRSDGETRLTAKLPPVEAGSEFKVSREWEVTVSDHGLMEAILRAVGFSPVKAYEKERETWLAGKTHVTVDRMPFGFFAELEGEGAEIRGLAARLGFSWDRRIIITYMKMFEIIKKGEGLVIAEPTFALFEGIAVPIQKYLPLFEAGK